MRIRGKLVLLLTGIVLLSTILMMAGAIWLNKRHFEEEMSRRFKIAGNLAQLSLNQKVEELLEGLRQINNDKETTRSLLVSLSARNPKRTNFFDYFFSMAGFARQHDIAQTGMHFVSAANPDFQLYGACEDEHVFSFSTEKGGDGTGLMELESDAYGFILPKTDARETHQFKLPLSIAAKTQSLSLYPGDKKLYVDIHFPMVNQSMGVERERSGGFAWLGFKYGVIRCFMELTPDWISNLEKKTDVKLDMYLSDGRHGLGDLKNLAEKFPFAGDRLFERTIGDTVFIGASIPIRLDDQPVGYLVASVPQSFLTDQIIHTVLTLSGIGVLSLALSVSLASLLAIFYVRPILELEKGADQLARGNLTVGIDTSGRDEVGNLARSFANMRDSVRKKIYDLNLLNEKLDQTRNDLEQLSLSLERKVNERTKALSRSERDLARAQRIARFGNWNWDIKSGGLFWSDEIYRIFGVDPERFTATYEAFWNFIHPDDREMVKNAVHATLYENREYNIDHRIVLPDHTERIVHEEGEVTFDQAGYPIRMLGIVHDVTEQKKAVIELENARLLADQANRAKSEFLANMSHEIRTPLNAILGLSHLALETRMTPQQSDYQQKIHMSANSLLRLINDILDFSKIEAGKLDMEHRNFSLENVLESMTSFVRVESIEKGLAFSTSIADSVPTRLVGDSLRLGQVITNLASNAVKFTDKGEVSVFVDLAEISERDVSLRFVVSDTGIGMDRKQIERLFQPFQQADATITRKFGGTGLGLAITNRLIEMMDGEIQVDSKPGVGSRFTFTARFGKSKEKTAGRMDAVSRDQAAELLAGRHLLLVEDNEINLQVAGELLAHIGIRTTIAENGKKALELAAREQFDGILMDLHMPVMDGLAATREIRKRRTPADLPILAMTASAMAGDRDKCIEAGMNDHIAKPIRPANLYETLIRWLKPDAFENLSKSATPAGAASLPNTIDDFPELDGVDVREGLHNVNGDRHLYLKVLKNVYTRYRDIVGQIRAKLDTGDFGAAERIAHTFKGLAGTVGAKELNEISLELESAIGKGETNRIPELTASLSTEAKRLMVALETLFQDKGQRQSGEHPDTGESGIPDMERLKAVFGKLSNLIEEGDSDALKLIREIRNLLGPAEVSDDIRKLESQIDDYEFEDALETLNRILRKQGMGE